MRSLKSALLLIAVIPFQLAAQSSPWGNVATILANEFSGPIARGFSLVAIVVGGLGLAFSDGGGKRTLGGLIFGLGMALGAAQFMTWLFV
ncbi:MAG: TrbC/VirB2 family protein [Acidobacteriia bacterium]|nr:TrbC/VirB2 family protein [Terriglobia bacterium]